MGKRVIWGESKFALMDNVALELTANVADKAKSVCYFMYCGRSSTGCGTHFNSPVGLLDVPGM